MIEYVCTRLTILKQGEIIMDTLELIVSLTKLVTREKIYKEWYEEEKERLQNIEDKETWVYVKERDNFNKSRIPTNANTNDALKLISRLSRQLVR